MQDDTPFQMSRRDLLQLIGMAGGASAMMGAMTAMGHALPSPYDGPPDLQGAPQGARVLILGAGLAGMTAAYELRNAGYDVQILEYQRRAGGRCWTLGANDEVEELGGYRQTANFAQGQYINIGPWRIPHHHRAVLDYCRRLNVPLEVFVQENQNAYVHSIRAFDGRPQRYHKIWADYVGGISEMLAKGVNQGAFSDQITQEDAEMVLESLKSFGVLDDRYRYVERLDVSSYRGYPDDGAPGGGVDERRADGRTPDRPGRHRFVALLAVPAQPHHLSPPCPDVPADRRHGGNPTRVRAPGWRSHHLQCPRHADHAGQWRGDG
ncbi:Tryptophan 2-monooxygenase [Roseibacterium elongatum DSM 19469]|uniref:Tryptophan 2-monooxygenase n=1 Tax=Roseicyclus elongatus DSM 19469 TaxID=1294273 RepID=W8RV60_9RHOB|nr:FAD-dependent oxidoreductase [Roseibacterium elongatum]AHM05089.1 Tryptophan 2-monooxygenase [Roseibacterium elongatum DSM 19469]